MSRRFRVTVTMAHGMASWEKAFDNAMDAVVDAALFLNNKPGKVDVRPVVEVTRGEGLARYPEILHPQASLEAHAGWAEASNHSRAQIVQQDRELRELGQRIVGSLFLRDEATTAGGA